MRKLIYAARMVAILAAAFVVVQRAMPNPVPVPAPSPDPAPEAASPTITWSVMQLSQTMFPGTSSTVTLSFKSDQNLTGVAVDITPSLNGVIFASPSNFASVTANQPYQVTFTLTAPPQFVKRSFGGTIHIKNIGSPPKTYSLPLAVTLQTDWNIFTDIALGFSISYPTDAVVQRPDANTVAFASSGAGIQEEHPILFIRKILNPQQKDIFAFFSGSEEQDLLQDSQGQFTTSSVSGAIAYIFVPAATFFGETDIVVVRPSYFLEIKDMSVSDLGERMLPSLSF